MATSWSTAKSFTSALVGIAIEKGIISSVDTSAAEFITEWAADERKNITIRDLLLMSSGLYEDGDDALDMYIGVRDENGQYRDVDNVYYSIERTVNPERARWLGAAYTWNYANADTQILGEIIADERNLKMLRRNQLSLLFRTGF